MSIVEEKVTDPPKSLSEDIGKPIDDEHDEPPLKKCRVEMTFENEEEDFTAVEIKEEPSEEPKPFEEIDDRFEEDDSFVDEVKKY
ncbi:hypothetical protein NQ314_011770 [Rhamnusium bicolor]|uniref:Uncharacterized protein n=1 Tax=Rhamnusium bicolor TaxID=1586634 RepID=A0AAV8XGQ5_9CUCU|nr:hypothetical protein NQ314_011770 [Rhamnusium bicolor]